MSEAKPKRRWLRFSLRALFAAIAVLCIWLGLTASAARRQRQAVAAIRSSGGTVFYNDHKYGNRGRLSELNPDSAGPIAPKWLRDWIGEDYFCNAVVVVLQGLDEAALNELTKLPDLRSVSIDTSRPLTVQDLQILGQLSGLRELHLMCPRIDAPAIVSLASLKRLKILRLVTSIDALLEQVGKLPAIACLRLSGNLATDSGFSHLKNLTNLDTLRLESFPISEDLLKALQIAAQLKTLELENCVDVGGELDGLKQLKQLTNLDLDYGGVSPRFITELQQSLPTAKITIR